VDREIAASLEAYAGADEEFVERAFREILRRPADEEPGAAQREAMQQVTRGVPRPDRLADRSKYRPGIQL